MENLKVYKQHQKALFEESIQAYQKDKLIRHQEAHLRSQDFQASIKQLQARLKLREGEQWEISKNYFNYKAEVQKSKDKIADERELLMIEKKALEEQLSKLKDLSLSDKEYAVDLYKQKTENFAQRFRKISQQNENDLKVSRMQFEKFQAESFGELDKLEKDTHIC